jgi:hypothetical protein
MGRLKKIGLATWRATGGSDEGFKAWDAWSYRVLLRRPIDKPRPSLCVRRRKPKDEKRLFICERRQRDPHAPWFTAPKAFRGAVAQYLPSRNYRLVSGSFEVKQVHSYLVDLGAVVFNMEIVSGHDSTPILAGALVSLWK